MVITFTFKIITFTFLLPLLLSFISVLWPNFEKLLLLLLLL